MRPETESKGEQAIPGSALPNYRDTLLRMYDVTNRKVDNLDTISVRIKTWGMTAWGVLAAQYISKGPDSEFVLVISALLVALLWIMDLHYKFFQEQFIALNMRIENKLLDDEIWGADIDRLSFRKNITGTIFTDKGVHPEFKKCFGRYWFHIPYFVLVLATCLLRIWIQTKAL